MKRKIMTITCAVVCVSVIYAFVLRASGLGSNLPASGQTAVYETGDDGTYQKGTAMPSVRFCDNKDGTVTDNMTGLTWLKNANSTGYKTWSAALAYVEALNNDAVHNCGYNDWRLPSVNELESLTQYATSPQSSWLNNQGFDTVLNDAYWSATSYAPDTDDAWYVYMSFGYVNYRDKTIEGYVWPVRSAR
jgi:hypothetical protein